MIRKGLMALFSVLVVFLLCAFWVPMETDAPGASDKRAAVTNAPETDAPDADKIMLNVYLNDEKGICQVPLEAYVAGVVAREMPDSYEPEALSAQAVAARTFAVYKSSLFSKEGCASHAGADVCASSACCQGYTAVDETKYKNAVRAAQETQGKIALFHAHPIRALYHASSGGHTENAENVYSEALAYLRGVPSPGEEDYTRFQTETEMTIDDLRKAFRAFPDMLFPDNVPLSEQLEVLSRSDTGRVTEMRVGLTGMSGSDFRRAAGLKSTLFEMEFTDNGVRFRMTGYGHGVGMSQAGAQAMALSGKTHEEILSHYYTGISFSTLAEWLESG